MTTEFRFHLTSRHCWELMLFRIRLERERNGSTNFNIVRIFKIMYLTCYYFSRKQTWRVTIECI